MTFQKFFFFYLLKVEANSIWQNNVFARKILQKLIVLFTIAIYYYTVNSLYYVTFVVINFSSKKFQNV